MFCLHLMMRNLPHSVRITSYFVKYMLFQHPLTKPIGCLHSVYVVNTLSLFNIYMPQLMVNNARVDFCDPPFMPPQRMASMVGGEIPLIAPTSQNLFWCTRTCVRSISESKCPKCDWLLPSRRAGCLAGQCKPHSPEYHP